MKLPWLAAGGAVVAVFVSGCTGETGGNPGDGDDCESHYAQVAKAPTLRALKGVLIEQTPRAESVRVVGRDGDKLLVNVLSAKPRDLLSLDVWQLDNGQWTAEQWEQCIDS